MTLCLCEHVHALARASVRVDFKLALPIAQFCLLRSGPSLVQAICFFWNLGVANVDFVAVLIHYLCVLLIPSPLLPSCCHPASLNSYSPGSLPPVPSFVPPGIAMPTQPHSCSDQDLL